MASTVEMLQQIFPNVIFYPFLLLVPWTLRVLWLAYATPLRSVPGPFFAKFTRIWYFRAVNSRSFHEINIQLHREHGCVVRIAPNEYSIDDPGAASTIYRSRDQLVKVCKPWLCNGR